MSRRSDQIAQLVTDDSFLRWINGKAAPVEQKKWDRWLEEDPANTHLLGEARDLYSSLEFEEMHTNTNMQLKELEKSLDVEQIYSKKVRYAGKGSHKSYWKRAAAVIVLLIAVLGIIQFAGWRYVQQQETAKAFETVQTDYGETKKLTFSDGSEITLNAHSSLTYPTMARAGGDMKVELQGEAYFSIDRKLGEQQRTFSVTTSEGTIAVQGTKFNVNTYSQNTEVVLEEGKVQVTTSEASKNFDQTYTMSPHELVRLRPGNQEIEIKKVDTKLFTSWIGFEFKFKNTPLKQIAERIEQIYGIDVEFNDENLKEVEFSGSAPSKNFAVLLEGLRTLLDIQIMHKGNAIIFGG